MDLITTRLGSGCGDSDQTKPIVLVVDDEDVVRDFMRRVLERSGYTVVEAADGPTGADAFQHATQPISAIVLDLSMPGMSGTQVFQRIRQADPSVPVVFTTGYDAAGTLGSLADGPNVRCLQKPFSPSTLTGALQEMLGPESVVGGVA